MKHSNHPTATPDGLGFGFVKSDISQLKDCPADFGEAILKNCRVHITLAVKPQQKAKGDSHA